MDRLSRRFPLGKGAHRNRGDGMCAMEMVAWLGGEEHSDEPRCACPVIAALVRAFNDALPSDGARTRWLRPLVPHLVNTRADAATERIRGFQVASAVVRDLVPASLVRTGRRAEAELFRVLPAVDDGARALVAVRALQAFARDQRAAIWVLERAAEGADAARFVAGAVHTAREVGDLEGYRICADLVLRLARHQDATQVPGAEQGQN